MVFCFILVIIWKRFLVCVDYFLYSKKFLLFDRIIKVSIFIIVVFLFLEFVVWMVDCFFRGYVFCIYILFFFC